MDNRLPGSLGAIGKRYPVGTTQCSKELLGTFNILGINRALYVDLWIVDVLAIAVKGNSQENLSLQLGEFPMEGLCLGL